MTQLKTKKYTESKYLASNGGNLFSYCSLNVAYLG